MSKTPARPVFLFLPPPEPSPVCFDLKRLLVPISGL